MDGLPFPLDVEFDDTERELGDSFVSEGAVDLTADGSDGFYEAEVRHFRRHVFVWVRHGPDGVTHGCDCPHFDDTGRGCEHLWALVKTIAGPGEDDAPAADEDGERSDDLRPRYRIDAVESERLGRIVVTLHDESGRPLALTHEAWADIHRDADIAAMRALAPAAGGWQDVRRGGGFVRPMGPYELEPGLARERLPSLAATGSLELGRPGRAPEPVEGMAPPLELALLAEPRGGAGVALDAVLLADTGALPVRDVAFVIAGEHSLALVERRLHPVAHAGGYGWLRTMRRNEPLSLARDRLPAFLSQMEPEHPLPRLVLPGNARPVPVRTTKPTARLEVRLPGAHGVLAPSFVYGDAPPVPPGRRGELLLSTAEGCQHRRDAPAEAEIIARLHAFGAEADPDGPAGFLIARDAVPALLEAVVAEGWVVLCEDRPVRQGTASPVSLRGKGDWFEIAGGIEVDGEPVPLPALLASLAAGDDLVEWNDQLVLVPERRRAELAAMTPLGEIAAASGDGLALSAAQTLLAAEVAPGDAVADDRFDAMRRRLTDFAGIAPVEPSPRLRAVLRPYQRDGLAWMAFLDELGLGGCLADEMGLGKTVQVIAELLRRNDAGASGPHLVVLPRSLIPNWAAELTRFAPSLDVVRHDGRRGLDPSPPAGSVVLTTYGLLRRHHEAMGRIDFDRVVLDEAQAIKNPRSKTARAARTLRARLRLALTGTPIENDLAELWSLMAFLNPGLLGSSPSLAGLMRLDETSGSATLRRALRPVLLRRVKEDVAPELPELLEQTVLCEMTGAQRKLYESVRAAAQAQLEGKSASRHPVLVLEALLRLRQVACDPRLVDAEAGDDESGKLDVLLARLEETREAGRKALVFSQFTRLLGLVRERLDEAGLGYAYLDGRTRDREQAVRDFEEDPDRTAFLISLRVGGTGLNLTAADTVFLLDPWWNPAVEAQAIARAHRIGQERRVVAQRLVSRGSVEEKILELQVDKRELADSILARDETALTAMTADDLAELLS